MLNALCDELMGELNTELKRIEARAATHPPNAGLLTHLPMSR